jgi:hypothetical protein
LPCLGRYRKSLKDPGSPQHFLLQSIFHLDVVVAGAEMGSSAKRKREKKKDFQVRNLRLPRTMKNHIDMSLEAEIEGGQGQADGSQSYRHQFPIKR